MGRVQPVVTRLARAAGLEVVPASGHRVVPVGFYRPIPDVATLPAETWDEPSDLRGIDLDLDAQLDLVEGTLAPFVTELAQLDEAACRWQPSNGLYDAGDGELTYALVRHLRPELVVELGSGWSTLVLAAAAAANRADGTPTRLVSHDPFPSDVVPEDLAGLDRLEVVRAQDVHDDVFAALGPNDVLFVDTTHTVQVGGDVNHIVLDVLPTLGAGVHVHFHDVFQPYEYHRDWADNGPWWSEQYLLQAFLAMNPGYEVVLATHALLRERRGRLGAVLPSLDDHQPSSFWIRSTGVGR